MMCLIDKYYWHLECENSFFDKNIMNNEEHRLIQRCQQGDRSAYEQIFLKYKDTVYNVAYGMLSNVEDTQDMTQDVFLHVFEKINQFRFKSSFSTWLYRIAVNMCISKLRKRKRRTQNIVGLQDYYSQTDSPKTPEDELMKKELQSQVQQALKTLSESHRTILTLREMDGLSYKELAEVLQCSVGRVKSRLHEARMELRRKIERTSG